MINEVKTIRILAIESSAKPASAAIAEDGRLISLYYQNSGMTHSKTLLPMIENMLSACMLDMSGIDLIAAAAGPGSFTGIRIGCAVGKGLGWASSKLCCPVSTLEAMAHLCRDFTDHLICACMDARRGQVYNALFTEERGQISRLCQDRALSVDELYDDIKNVEKSILLIGDGAELCYNHMRETQQGSPGCRLKLASEHIRFQNAWGVALAAMSKAPSQYGDLNPVYLRPSQAERERLGGKPE